MATIDNGKPHVVSLWYYYFDGTNIVLTVTKDMKKGQELEKNPNFSIAIDVIEGEPGNISFLKGKAMIIEGEAA
jgi:nitroimidazol reductase NimA-like FMN-containing flavoprotein (pyridoxamine 5'-phosphate oxidase superfamily)